MPRDESPRSRPTRDVPASPSTPAGSLQLTRGAPGTDDRGGDVLERYGPQVSLAERASYLTDQLLMHPQARHWKNAVAEELLRSASSLDQLCNSRANVGTTPNSELGDGSVIYNLMDNMGLKSKIRRVVLDLHCEITRAAESAAEQHAREEEMLFIPGSEAASNGCALDVVSEARENWERITRDELLRFAREKSKALLVPQQTIIQRQQPAQVEDGELDLELPVDPRPVRSYRLPPSIRFLYDGKDLLHTLQAIKYANRSTEAAALASSAWGSIQLNFYSPSSLELRRLFAELTPGNGQLGADESFPDERQLFISEKTRVGGLVLSHSSVSMARQYAKTGCPTSIRASLWQLALGQLTTAEHNRHFQLLVDQVQHWTYLTDDMYLLDLQNASDSSDYFVFQDHLDKVIMAFTRDDYVHRNALQVNGTVQLLADEASAERSILHGTDPPPLNTLVPPNGVLPFSGLAMYLAPLTYIYSDEITLYFVFREMYVRYWSRLNAIRSDKSTILTLCKLFEDLVARSSPVAVVHLLDVGLKPLDIAFPWIQTAFSGVLEISQVLLLWDRLIGYDSLDLLAVFAAALFHFRAEELGRISSLEEVSLLYAENLEIQAIPLLQEYLFLLS